MPAANHREVEAKFQVAPDQLPLLDLQTLSLDGYTSQIVGTLTHTDTYMDTAAYDLLRHGLALRLRHNGTDHEVGIKSITATRKGAIQNRMEVSILLPPHAKPFEPATWPNDVEEQLASYTVKMDDLRPLVVVRQQREKALLRPADSERALAEWSLDEVWIGTRPRNSKASREVEDKPSFHTHFYELELELLAPENEAQGDEEVETLFATFVARVQDRFDLSPIYTSKFVRGLESALAQVHGNVNALTPTMALEAAGRLLLHQQLLQIMLNEHGVRTSKKESYVHDMRVAIRRAGAAIQLCANAFPHNALAPYAKGLRRLGRALGAVRDLDVALANLRVFRRSQSDDQSKGIKLLRAELKERRNQAHAKLLKLLDSKKQRKFVRKFAAFCVTASASFAEAELDAYEVLPSQVRHTLPSTILRAFEALRAYEVAFIDNHLPPLETFHALRKQAKHLRYLLEFTQHLLGERGENLALQLRELQEHLGELNDAHVEQLRLGEWAEKTQKESALYEAITTRLSQIAIRISDLTTTFPTHFADFIGSPNRENLAILLARL